jgi:beta-glucosidase
VSFPKNFAWGTATAAYQVEGAADSDGKGPSVWDMHCRKPGAIVENQSGAVACDHYHRYQEDVALMKRLGCRAYRFSVSWPRVLPEGVGRINSKGLDFYDRLVDALCAAKVEPYLTLFHWDYPYHLHCRGGWLNPDSPKWFAEYTGVVADRLSDRVRHWMTVNEPHGILSAGYDEGTHAPGERLARRELMKVSHNLLLSHGRSVQTLRARVRAPALIGFAPAATVKMPATLSRKDIAAARQAMFEMDAKAVGGNSFWMDPVFKGHYPKEGLEAMGADAPVIGPDDMKLISQPLDFFGVNIYHGRHVRAGKDGKWELVPLLQGHSQVAFRWPVTPDALYWGPKFLYERYRLPIVITENGVTGLDWLSLDGGVHDPQRIDFMQRYLLCLEKAIDEGVDVRGYMHWTFMDNFEWTVGYTQRFGLVFVDYPTQRRIPKDSALWYSRMIATNGRSLHARRRTNKQAGKRI